MGQLGLAAHGLGLAFSRLHPMRRRGLSVGKVGFGPQAAVASVASASLLPVDVDVAVGRRRNVVVEKKGDASSRSGRKSKAKDAVGEARRVRKVQQQETSSAALHAGGMQCRGLCLCMGAKITVVGRRIGSEEEANEAGVEAVITMRDKSLCTSAFSCITGSGVRSMEESLEEGATGASATLARRAVRSRRVH